MTKVVSMDVMTVDEMVLWTALLKVASTVAKMDEMKVDLSDASTADLKVAEKEHHSAVTLEIHSVVKMVAMWEWIMVYL